MITKTLSFIALFFLLAACSENKKDQQHESIDHAPQPESVAGDYMSINGKDTVRLTLQSDNKQISGQLDILPFEKDARKGAITNGQMKGDTLFATYSAQEGQRCACEIAFLKKGDSYVLTNDIFGETNYQYNKEYTKGKFKDRGSIAFDGYVLEKVDK